MYKKRQWAIYNLKTGLLIYIQENSLPYYQLLVFA